MNHASSFTFYWLSSVLTRSYTLLFDKWYGHVYSQAFDDECNEVYKHLLSGSESGGSSASKRAKISQDAYSSSDTSYESVHEVSKLERLLYYFGLGGNGRPGPKLVYRTSADVFTPPAGPDYNLRVIQLLPVYEHSKLSQDNLWSTIRGEVVKLLDKRQIRHTSVDLARFGWDEQNEEGGRKPVTTRVTIWIGLLPDITSGEAAFNSSQDILELLKQYKVDDLEVAYRESVVHPLAGSELFAPVDNDHHLKDVIDWVTTSLSLPIAGLKTLHMQGTLGFYFRVGDDFYGVTARHVLFPAEEGNHLYKRVAAAPKKKVVLMGTQAFEDFLASIKAKIGNFNNTVSFLKKRATTQRKKVGACNEQAANDLAITEADIERTNEAIEALKAFFATMKKDEWSDVNNRVIGHVVWAPPISGSNDPYNYTKDVCVIKLDNRKFAANFKGNVIDLGTKIEAGEFMWLMCPRNDAPSDFDYPDDRLYKLQRILTAAQIKQPNSQDLKGDPVRYVIKNGHTTATTIGRLNGFESHVRFYGILGSLDSIEAAVYPYDNDSGSFSKGGDSGAEVAGAYNEFGLQLTGGAGPTESPDVTYCTPMFWLWDSVIKREFPGADLYFDEI